MDKILKKESGLEVVIHRTYQHFYQKKWFNATGGGMAIKKEGFVYFIPSYFNEQLPDSTNVKKIAIVDIPTNIDMCSGIFPLPDGFSTVVHTHSVASIRAANYWGKKYFKSFCFKKNHITKNLDGIIGAKASGSAGDENLEVPIIEKNNFDDIVNAATVGSNVNSVLVEDHGLYVFGETWQQAKVTCETLEFLFELELELELTKKPEAETKQFALLQGL
ncbi:probable methylthioribulose-1-phosphate dehydratase [Sitodiplosis mosellana]|uniref:probable methylthioribulose-1-phosphate dehydratase n=1 Tax=Sitodiplosis mosellana TaxID=263140 RepID=UPI002443B0B1|nr:probable methylthioribulose-1-phosphate dehydratase [Sitodiplosis mosellana]